MKFLAVSYGAAIEDSPGAGPEDAACHRTHSILASGAGCWLVPGYQQAAA